MQTNLRNEYELVLEALGAEEVDGSDRPTLTGILAYGFVRVRCGNGGHERLYASFTLAVPRCPPYLAFHAGGRWVATHSLTTLGVHPQGSFPEIDPRDRLSATNPSLQLPGSGIAPLTFRDPDSNLLVTVVRTFTTTASGARVGFGETPQRRRLLLSSTMTLEFRSTQTSTLSFAGEPGTISRAHLLDLAPELEGEQLLEPVSGTLGIVFHA